MSSEEEAWGAAEGPARARKRKDHTRLPWESDRPASRPHLRPDVFQMAQIVLKMRNVSKEQNTVALTDGFGLQFLRGRHSLRSPFSSPAHPALRSGSDFIRALAPSSGPSGVPVGCLRLGHEESQSISPKSLHGPPGVDRQCHVPGWGQVAPALAKLISKPTLCPLQATARWLGVRCRHQSQKCLRQQWTRLPLNSDPGDWVGRKWRVGLAGLPEMGLLQEACPADAIMTSSPALWLLTPWPGAYPSLPDAR